MTISLVGQSHDIYTVTNGTSTRSVLTWPTIAAGDFGVILVCAQGTGTFDVSATNWTPVCAIASGGSGTIKFRTLVYDPSGVLTSNQAFADNGKNMPGLVGSESGTISVSYTNATNVLTSLFVFRSGTGQAAIDVGTGNNTGTTPNITIGPSNPDVKDFAGAAIQASTSYTFAGETFDDQATNNVSSRSATATSASNSNGANYIASAAFVAGFNFPLAGGTLRFFGSPGASNTFSGHGFLIRERPATSFDPFGTLGFFGM